VQHTGCPALSVVGIDNSDTQIATANGANNDSTISYQSVLLWRRSNLAACTTSATD